MCVCVCVCVCVFGVCLCVCMHAHVSEQFVNNGPFLLLSYGKCPPI